MADLPMPDGLSESERQQWLRQLRRHLVEETGQSHGVVEKHVPAEQPMWAIWGTTEVADEAAQDEVEPTHVPGLARTFGLPLAPGRADRPGNAST